jgi:hypothetical protein
MDRSHLEPSPRIAYLTSVCPRATDTFIRSEVEGFEISGSRWTPSRCGERPRTSSSTIRCCANPPRPGSVDSLARGIEALLDAPLKRRAEMGARGASRARELHDPRQQGLQLAERFAEAARHAGSGN